MNKAKISEPDLDNCLKHTLEDDLPPDAELRMSRHFLSLRRTLDQTANLAEPDRWLSLRGAFRNEVLAFASAVLLIAGGVMHLGGNQSVLAHSIERLKIVVTVSAGLRRATSMDCTVRVQGVQHDQSSYRVRWAGTGVTRVDMNATGHEERTLWVSDETVSMAGYAGIAVRSVATVTVPRDPEWRPALEFLTPAMLAENLEKRYELIQSERQDKAGLDAFLLVGRKNQQVIEITVDARTYLPIKLKKYPMDSHHTRNAQTCFEEVWFHWSQPIPPGLLVPKSPAGNQKVHY